MFLHDEDSVRACAAQFSDLDVLVNNAGMYLRGTISESFSQVNPPEDVPPLQTANTAGPTENGGTAVTASFN